MNRMTPAYAVGLGLLAAGCASAPPLRAPSSPAPLAGPATPAADHRMDATAAATDVHISDEILAACGLSRDDAYFSFDSSNVDEGERGILQKLARCFISGSMRGRTMRLVGHADPRGETEYNFVLGQARAESVARYLELEQVRHTQIVTTSRGELDATGHDEPGWAHDRRVDILAAR